MHLDSNEYAWLEREAARLQTTCQLLIKSIISQAARSEENGQAGPRKPSSQPWSLRFRTLDSRAEEALLGPDGRLPRGFEI